MKFISPEKINKIKKFAKFVKSELKIKSLPKLRLVNGRKDGIKTTASYDYTQEIKVVKINVKGRALVDILRSFAHELVHHKQWEDGKLTNSKKDGADGSPIENEANAKSGLLIRKYNKVDESIYDDL